MKYFQFGPSVCPPSCWRHASWPSSRPTFTRRHLLGLVVVATSEVLRAEQPEHAARRHRGHVAPLLVEPLRVALLRHAVADEGRARRAQRDQLVRVHRQVAGVPAAEGRLRRRRTSGSCRPSSDTRPSPSGSRPPRRNCAGAASRRPRRTIRRAPPRSAARTPSLPARPCRSATRRRCRRAWRPPPRRSRDSRARAPRPTPRRAATPQSSGFRGWPLLTRPMMPRRQPRAVVGLDARRVQEREAPAAGDELLGGGRVGAERTGRRTEPGAAGGRRRRAESLPEGAAAKHDHHRHRPLDVGRGDERQLDLHDDRRAGGVVHVANHLPAGHRDSADRAGRALGDRPGHLGHALRDSADHFTLEVLDDLRPTRAATTPVVVTFVPLLSVRTSGRFGNGLASASS